MKKVEFTFEWIFGFAVMYDRAFATWTFVLPFCVIQYDPYEKPRYTDEEL